MLHAPCRSSILSRINSEFWPQRGVTMHSRSFERGICSLVAGFARHAPPHHFSGMSFAAVQTVVVRQYSYTTGLVPYVRSLVLGSQTIPTASGASTVAVLDHDRSPGVYCTRPGLFKSLLSQPVPTLFIRPFYDECFDGPMAALKPGARYIVIGNEGSEFRRCSSPSLGFCSAVSCAVDITCCF